MSEVKPTEAAENEPTAEAAAGRGTDQILSPEVPPAPEPAAPAEEPELTTAGNAPETSAQAAATARGTAAHGEPAKRAAPAPAAGAGRSGRRKVREGTVVSNAMEKTAVVVVIERVRHPRYAKTVQRTKRLYVHDEANDVRVGDRVRLSETRPLSKLKRWRVERVLERAR
jgi:small subunit ribosomal protein S17